MVEVVAYGPGIADFSLDYPFLKFETLAELSAYCEGSADSEIVLLPFHTGRDATLESDLARAASWISKSRTVYVAEAVGDATQTLAALRGHFRKLAKDHKGLVIARSVDPFADAELFRIARLAWVNGNAAEIGVAFEGAYPSRSEWEEIHGPADMVVRADFEKAEGDQLALWSPSQLKVLIERRVHTALHRGRDHGDNGIERAMMRDHDHGFAHSHGDDHSHTHEHPHSHAHGHHHHH
ncbi:MAG: hypothetical protein Q3962_07490 [Corynebacterium sp.]|nr:hypothetical protein [Corynebacterium sp.]